MNDQQRVLEALARAAFPFWVAVHDGHDPELGPVLEVQAFDVPEERSVNVSLDLTKIVRRCALTGTALAGAFDVVESSDRRAYLPRDTAWYRPGEVVDGDRGFMHALACVEDGAAWTSVSWSGARSSKPADGGMLVREAGATYVATGGWNLAEPQPEIRSIMNTTYALAS